MSEVETVNPESSASKSVTADLKRQINGYIDLQNPTTGQTRTLQQNLAAVFISKLNGLKDKIARRVEADLNQSFSDAHDGNVPTPVAATAQQLQPAAPAPAA